MASPWDAISTTKAPDAAPPTDTGASPWDALSTTTPPEAPAAPDTTVPPVQMPGVDAESPTPTAENAPVPADTYLAGTVGQSTLGPAGSPDARDLAVRADMGLSDNPGDKLAKFLKAYPQGDAKIVQVPEDVNASDAGQWVMLVKRTPDAPWSRLEDPTLAGTAGQIADASGAAPGLAGQAAGTVLGGGLGFLGRIAASVGGQVVGDAIKYGTEYLRGYTPPAAQDALLHSSLEGALGAVTGDLLGAGLRTTYGATRAVGRTMTGAPLAGFQTKGLTAVIGDAAQADAFAARNGLPGLTVGQLTKQPLIQRVEQQIMAKGATVGTVYAKQQNAASGALSSRVDVPALQRTNAVLGHYWDEAHNDVITAFNRPGITLAGSGNNLIDAIEQWRDVTRATLGQMYDAAHAVGDPVLDATGVRGQAQRYLALAQHGAMDLSPTMQGILQRMASLGDRIGPQTIPDPANPGQNLVVGGETVLNNLRAQLYDIQHPRAGVMEIRTPAEQAAAGELRTMLRSAVENPVNAEQLGGDFRTLWRQANDYAAERFNQQEAFDALLGARAMHFQPQAVVEKLWNASGDDTIRTVYNNLHDAGLGARWDRIAEGFKQRVIDTALDPAQGPKAALGVLGKFEPDTLSRLMTRTDLAGVRDTIQATANLNKLDIPAILAKGHQATQAVLDLMKNADSAGIERLNASLAPNDPLRQSIRAGLLDNLSTLTRTLKGTGAQKGQVVLDGPAIQTALARMDTTGASKFLTQDDKDLLLGLTNYLKFTQGMGDVGTSMQAGEAAAELQSAAGLKGEAIQHAAGILLHAFGLGRLMTSKFGRAILIDMNPSAAGHASGSIIQNLTRFSGAAALEISNQFARESEAGLR